MSLHEKAFDANTLHVRISFHVPSLALILQVLPSVSGGLILETGAMA